MRVFIDTSAIVGYMVAEDSAHERAAKTWEKLLDDGTVLVTSNYIVIETVALLQKRFGLAIARLFIKNMLPEFELLWIDESIHQSAVEAWDDSASSKVSLVDYSSFVIMRHQRISHAFVFDKHFRQQGFNVLG